MEHVIKSDRGDIIKERASPERTIEQDLENKELGKAIEKALNKLSSEQKVAIVLRHVEGKSFGEISKICGCPEGTISARISRGMIEIRKYLKPFAD